MSAATRRQTQISLHNQCIEARDAFHRQHHPGKPFPVPERQAIASPLDVHCLLTQYHNGGTHLVYWTPIHTPGWIGRFRFLHAYLSDRERKHCFRLCHELRPGPFHGVDGYPGSPSQGDFGKLLIFWPMA
jgi:hypothetical protein